MGNAARLPPDLRAFARSMRQDPTDAEERLWRLLRGKALGVRFRRQHPVGRYILDFFCARLKLAVELDGSQHGDSNQARYDERRSQYLETCGIKVIRFANEHLLKNPEDVLEEIWAALDNLGA